MALALLNSLFMDVFFAYQQMNSDRGTEEVSCGGGERTLIMHLVHVLLQEWGLLLFYFLSPLFIIL
jgi:hypothetical protein